MLVIVKSGPETAEGRRGVKLARDMAGNLLLIQNGAYFSEKEKLEGFCGSVYVLDEDRGLRGIAEMEKGVKPVSYDEVVDLMTEEDKVTGAF